MQTVQRFKGRLPVSPHMTAGELTALETSCLASCAPSETLTVAEQQLFIEHSRPPYVCFNPITRCRLPSETPPVLNSRVGCNYHVWMEPKGNSAAILLGDEALAVVFHNSRGSLNLAWGETTFLQLPLVSHPQVIRWTLSLTSIHS